jgi:hypothetical protein
MCFRPQALPRSAFSPTSHRERYSDRLQLLRGNSYWNLTGLHPTIQSLRTGHLEAMFTALQRRTAELRAARASTGP